MNTSVRVLLADDHAVVRAGIRQFMERAGDIQVVAEAGDGAEAQSLIERHKPDVAVLDIQMPRASGIEVTRRVRANIPTTGVLILTAYDDDPDIRTRSAQVLSPRLIDRSSGPGINTMALLFSSCWSSLQIGVGSLWQLACFIVSSVVCLDQLSLLLLYRPR